LQYEVSHQDALAQQLMKACDYRIATLNPTLQKPTIHDLAASVHFLDHVKIRFFRP
jgi:hypothetical protein